jgi:hypothetical protein
MGEGCAVCGHAVTKTQIFGLSEDVVVFVVRVPREPVANVLVASMHWDIVLSPDPPAEKSALVIEFVKFTV